MEHVDDVPHRVRGVVGLGVRRGTAVALLIGEHRIGYDLQEVIGRPSALLDEGLMEMLKHYDDAANRVVHRLFVDEIVRDTLDPAL